MVYPETFTALGVIDFDDYLHPKVFEYTPQEFRDFDVDIKIEACGVCGSDVHAVSGNWGRPYAPVAVGHEIIGTIIKIGPKAKASLKLGDRVGVGAQCDCDHTCGACKAGMENYCDNSVGTYFAQTIESKQGTIGGNASHVRVNSSLVFKIPDNIDTQHAAPLLCGGITGFAPLLQAGVKKGDRVGVVGIGGIGHMTILFAKALGCEVTAISRSKSKEADAEKLGADHYLATNDEEAVAAHKHSLDLIVNTGSSFSESAVDHLFPLLKARGKFTFITFPPLSERLNLRPVDLLVRGISVQGSLLGSVEEIEYMLDFASKHNIKPWVETLEMNEENLSQAWQRMQKGDVHYRFTMIGYDKFFKDA
ncbi:uncharacterized protein SAPINGB_P002051 [Magnusiomyces paraingens]|uniref:Enoyl reductase (ER) domain-containing protein n=1 Tax=Magnusiomyces paraingens TaxID=2606893 RepID=A0A5E8BHJ7_9ASCO|nr:uncharacterized protein SAPINGB_P002051 [Saprochaete ingens]VVT48993.1 unnamed protein product [Saprochaete ingens]